MNQLRSLPVMEVRGIGDETAKQLASLQLYSVFDLLEHFPFRYEDYQVRPIEEIKHDERATVVGTVQSEPTVRYYGKKKNRMSVRVLVGHVLLTAVFFNRAFLKQQLKVGQEVTLTGKWDQHRLTLTVNEVKQGNHTERATVEPIYSVSGKLTSKTLKKYIHVALRQFGEQITDPLPPEIRERYKLVSKREAVFHLHMPSDREALKQARRRMVYEEFLFFQLKMQAFRKVNREQSNGRAVKVNEQKVDQFIAALPFSLTEAQEKVAGEILTDMSSPYRMNRLLQGDVGSGKTVVAAICMFAAVTARKQAALMVPTEILAEQHAQSLERLFAPSGVRLTLLTGSVKGKRRQAAVTAVKAGDVDVVIGTHALIQDDVAFHDLGLVITDEQHRFGVEQRRALRDKGAYPDVLFMTATPIPRTLAISAFGDMDVSIINQMPAGRKEIETYWAKHDMLTRVLDFMEKELAKGRQAYVICPLIEESEKLDVQNAIDVHSILQQHFEPRFQVGLMHGRLHPSEKDTVMTAFSENKIRILVSTTVVEVGVNVPNATIMVIYDAERFGLAQLHQLRGRVGRGEHQSYCILLADPKSEVGKERMRIMTETNDGFTLSERDLELRGPGDFFGAKQSGLPDFKVADVVHDYRALETARQDAATLVNSKTFWSDPKYRELVTYLQAEGVLDGEKLD
ncbi:ATP-dependent DNA helicase RecG [Halalkalibacterium halodurans]|uniref:ATP-dependent DNA helicase RecG n=1 Tax=Halalkalibacterium halodurans TaxID=86665 RepID=UPI002E1A41B2|nr:ATP-dependent DNA helicase RecG [Halalkalibacterium halodurans]MED4124487.1 ATP-dependent DNA helicase RecG [Halalkalibacterium halodurans]